MNEILEGEYKGYTVDQMLGHVFISKGLGKNQFELTKRMVKSIEVMTEDKRKSATSAVGRAAVGGLLLGPLGLLAGLSAKNVNIYLVSITFSDGKKCLAEVNDAVYKALLKLTY